MKILIYGDYRKWKSGYAREIRDILPHLKKGNDVRQVALGYNGYPIDTDMVVYHAQTPETKDHYAPEVLHYALDDFQPDIVLTVQDFWVLPKLSFVLAHPGKFKWVHWGTLDAEPLDFYSRESLKWMHYCFWQSHFGAIQTKMVEPGLLGEVIYPSVDPKIFHQLDKEALRKEFKLDTFQVLICNARGQLRKNVPVLLDAFIGVVKELPDTCLILSSGIKNTKTDKGTFDGHDLERFVSEAGLIDYVLLPRGMDRGAIDDKTLNIQYNLADINILPSWGEGFGLPFIEAGISNVPSIGVNNSAVSEIVKNRGILIEPRAYTYNQDGSRYSLCHPDDLKEAIIKLLKDEKLRTKYGKAAHEFAEKLTPESRATQMLKVFKKLIKDKAEPLARR